MKVDSKEISFVVQGPVSLNKYGITQNGFTDICLKSIRLYYPSATIILSTWKGSNITGLDYDLLVENDDPGPNQMMILNRAASESNQNCFRQIVSTINGLRAVKTKYAFKIRADNKLTNNNIPYYYLKYNKLNSDDNFKLLNNRVVTLTTSNPHRRTKYPFHNNDFIFFGLTEDLINIFDIPLLNDKLIKKDQNGNEIFVINPISPEQYIWTKFLSKYTHISLEAIDDISNDNIKLSEKYFANNCIFLSSRRSGVFWQKDPMYKFWSIPALSPNGIYTLDEYKYLLNKYANNNIFIIPNIPEVLLYTLFYNSRFFIKELLKKLRLIK